MVLDKSYQKDAPLAVIHGQFYNPRTFVCPPFALFPTLIARCFTTSGPLRHSHFPSRNRRSLLNTFINCYSASLYLSLRLLFFFGPQERSNVLLIFVFFRPLWLRSAITVVDIANILYDMIIISLVSVLSRNLLITTQLRVNLIPHLCPFFFISREKYLSDPLFVLFLLFSFLSCFYYRFNRLKVIIVCM